MIDCIHLFTSLGKFYAHYFQGESKHLFVFIPGLMEPKAGLFYIWRAMARYFHTQGHSCLLFDLAGQGDSSLPFCFNLWIEQRDAIFNMFKGVDIHFIARGIGAFLLPSIGLHIAIYPSLFDPVAAQLQKIRWISSPLDPNLLTLSNPHMLSKRTVDCFHRLGAEAECIGGIQLPTTFVNELICKLPQKLPDNVLCYEAGEGHPLFDKLSQRHALLYSITNDLKQRMV